MARRRGTKIKTPAEKTKPHPTITALARVDENGNERHAYQIMDWLIEKYHSDLAEANIVIANHMSGIKEDADGTVGFGRVKRGNDLDRAFADFDFVLIIPYDMFQHSDVDKRHAIIDSLLCQCAVKKDKHGEPCVNSENKTIFRTRKPIKVFPENIRRYGLWQSEAVKDAAEAFHDSKRPLLPENRKQSKRFNEPALDQGEAPPDSHLKNGNGKAHPNGHAGGKAGKAAKNRKDAPAPEAGSLESLELPHPILEACHAAGFTAVEDVCQFVAENSRLALAELKNMGSERADALWSAVEQFLGQHAEATGAN
jgi:hypothetical protein